jgi:hypothetical protein
MRIIVGILATIAALGAVIATIAKLVQVLSRIAPAQKIADKAAESAAKMLDKQMEGVTANLRKELNLPKSKVTEERDEQGRLTKVTSECGGHTVVMTPKTPEERMAANMAKEAQVAVKPPLPDNWAVKQMKQNIAVAEARDKFLAACIIHETKSAADGAVILPIKWSSNKQEYCSHDLRVYPAINRCDSEQGVIPGIPTYLGVISYKNLTTLVKQGYVRPDTGTDEKVLVELIEQPVKKSKKKSKSAHQLKEELEEANLG